MPFAERTPIIELAFHKKISGEAERFNAYVHPKDAINEVEKEIARIETRIVRLENEKP